MTGVAVFKKSISQIYYNFSDALKIGGLLWLIALVANAVLVFSVTGTSEVQTSVGRSGLSRSLMTMAGLAIQMVILTWIAIAWHRYMLLQERPQGYLPKWPSGLVWPYILKSLLIALLLIVAMIIPIAIVTMLAYGGILPQTFVPLLLLLVAGTIAYYVSLRLSIALPAVALGNPLSISEAWRVTESAKGAIFVLATLILASSLLMQLVAYIGLIHPIVMFAVSLVTSWMLVMVSITVLTTLYGVLIEGRTLD